MKDANATNLLVNKLILLVLTLNLVCMIYLIFRQPEPPVVQVQNVVPRETRIQRVQPPVVEPEITPPAPVLPPPLRRATSAPPVSPIPEPIVATHRTRPLEPEVVLTPGIPAAPPLTPLDGPGAIPPTGVTRSRPVELTLLGNVYLKGMPPPEEPIALDADCNRLRGGLPLITSNYVVGPKGELADVLVYIKEGVEKSVPQSWGRTLNIRACQIQPYVLGVQAGQPLRIQNWDTIAHILQSDSKVNKLNYELPGQNELTDCLFDRPEVPVQIKCSVHPWMVAYVGVFEHAAFAVTDRAGWFGIVGQVQPGKCKVAAWHPKAGELVQEVAVQDRSGRGKYRKDIQFTFTVPKAAARSFTRIAP